MQGQTVPQGGGGGVGNTVPGIVIEAKEVAAWLAVWVLRHNASK